MGYTIFESRARRSVDGVPSAWQEQFTQILPMIFVGCLYGRELVGKASGIQLRWHVFSSIEGSAEGTEGQPDY